jgi:hypothetical protein
VSRIVSRTTESAILSFMAFGPSARADPPAAAAQPEHVTLTVAVLRASALSGHGTNKGAASTCLADARPGTRFAVTVRPGTTASGSLEMANGYTFTADILAWGAMTAAADGVEGTGARVPFRRSGWTRSRRALGKRASLGHDASRAP